MQPIFYDLDHPIENEWTDEGIQSSKNLINRIERYFVKKTKIPEETYNV